MSNYSRKWKWKYGSIAVIAIVAIGFSFAQIFGAALQTAFSSRSITTNAEAAPQSGNTSSNVHVSFKGKSAEAYWYSYDEPKDGIYTDAGLFATDFAYKQKSEKYEESVVYIFINQYKEGEEVCEIIDGEEYCYVEYIPILAFGGYTTLTPDAFSVTGGTLRSATLNAEITGYDYATDTEKTITINALWSGTGDLSSGKSSERFRSDGFHYASSSTGISRGADVSATIGGDISLTLDTPPLDVVEDASIHSAKQGYTESVRFDQ